MTDAQIQARATIAAALIQSRSIDAEALGSLNKDISNHKLVFTPVANQNGTGYASFKFQVEDNGAGANLDPTAKVLDIRLR